MSNFHSGILDHPECTLIRVDTLLRLLQEIPEDYFIESNPVTRNLVLFRKDGDIYEQRGWIDLIKEELHLADEEM